MSDAAKSDAGGEARTFDDRCAYAVVEPVFHTIARLSPDVPDADAAWEAFIASREPGQRKYFEAIHLSRHSIFLYQQHRLYEFGSELTARSLDDFCADCGRQFMRMFSVANVYGFLKAAFTSRGSLAAMIVDMLRENLDRYAPGHFVLTDEVGAEEITLEIRAADPEAAGAYFAGHGLDAARCFRSSFHFVAGSLDKSLSYVVAGYDASRVDFLTSGQEGRMRFPTKGIGKFGRETVMQKVMGYVDVLLKGKREADEETDEESHAGIVMRSDAMRRTWDRIRRASRSNEIVLLRGESGTGKSLIARRIHEMSARREGPFIEVALTSDIGSDNMVQSDLFGHEKGAFTGASEQKQGLFSLADGGTIFLDEVGDATGDLQAKLLRVVERSTFKRLGGLRDIQVDVRVIAATNRDLEKMVEEGSFREDLYYRLSVIPVEIPPLRQRRDCVPGLVEVLLARAAAGGAERKEIGAALVEELSAYDWPGNVRELDHALKHAIAMGEGAEMTPEDFPAPVRAFLESRLEGRDKGPKEVAPAPPGEGARPGEEAAREGIGIIDPAALRRAIRSSDPVSVGETGAAHGIPAHIEHAKRTYLAALIDEFGGDLSLIAKYWDRRSVKTIRNLIKEYGLADQLDAARARGPRPKQGPQQGRPRPS